MWKKQDPAVPGPLHEYSHCAAGGFTWWQQSGVVAIMLKKGTCASCQLEFVSVCETERERGGHIWMFVSVEKSLTNRVGE